MVGPGTVNNDSTSEDSDGSTIITDDATTVEGAGGDENETTDENTGSDEGPVVTEIRQGSRSV